MQDFFVKLAQKAGMRQQGWYIGVVRNSLNSYLMCCGKRDVSLVMLSSWLVLGKV